MEKLTDAFSRYVRGKVRAGADVIQLFDSWVGALSPQDYEEFVQPYSARILAAVDCPTIHFGTGTATLLEQMRDAGGDVIGLDSNNVNTGPNAFPVGVRVCNTGSDPATNAVATWAWKTSQNSPNFCGICALLERFRRRR